MEETIQQRRSRPYSRAETISSRDRDRITPTNSSNSSSTYLPSRNKKVRESDGASMLHERLRERKVESARQSRRQSIDSASVDYRNFQSSPMKANHSRDDRRPSSSGIGAAAPSKKAMGVKQIEEQVSTLHKQNFDLKLELYHRRERQEKLESRLEAAEARLAEQEELQEVNEQLLAELEKRDQAVEEAVGIICDLEEKVEKLMEEREIVRKFDAQNEAGYFRGNHEGPPSSPPSLEASQDSKSSQLQVNSQTGGRLVRMPSFLSDQSEGAEALKSLYIPMDRGYSGSNLPKLLEDGKTEDGMDSPRLSVLSESSFLSVYGEKPLSLNSADAQDEAESPPQRRHRASSAVEKWVDDRPVKSNTPPAQLRPTRVISSTRKSQLLSINSVLESPLQRLERGEHRLEKLRMRLEQGNKSSPSKQEGQMERSPSEQEKREEKRKSREVVRRMVTDKASFDRQQTLPPTPDTVSTSTLRHYKNSNDTLHERNQAGDGGEAMYLTDSAKFPVPVATHNAYQSMLSMRPRSAGETVTSRREGHGWDTETQDDFTETGSISSTGTYDTPRKSGVISPDLFSFGGQDDGRLWARDVMFNHESAARLPTHKQQPSDNYRLNRAEPRSDQTVTPEYSEVQRTRFNSGSTQSSTSPIDTSPRPDPPARRSSLSAAAKLRKAPPSLNHSRDHSQGSQSPQSKESKRSRFTGLFARSSTSPSVNGKFPNREESSSNGNTHDNGDMPVNNDMGIGIVGVTSNRADFNRPQNGSRLSSRRGVDDDELDRATPPPIQRSRPTQTYVRPNSAGAGATRNESAFANGFGGEASNDRRSIDVECCAETEEANGKNGNGGGRKWLGKLSRAGSLSKRT